EPEIQNPRILSEPQSIDAREAGVTVGALHELVAKPGAPHRCEPGRLRQSLQMEPACVFSANHNRKGVVETERRQYFEAESLFVLSPYASEDVPWIAPHRIVQDRCQRSAGILHIRVDSSRKHSLLADEASRQIKAPLNMQMRPPLDLLRENLAEQSLLWKVFGPDDNRVPSRAAC